MYFPQGLCFSLPSACSDASQNWNKLELETKIAAAWGGRAALLLRLIPPTTLHELTSVKETVCKLIWPYRSSLTTSEMQIHECTSIPAGLEGMPEPTFVSGWTDIRRDSTAAFCLRCSYVNGEKKEDPDSENPSDSGNGFIWKEKILSVLILQQSMYEWTF